VSERGGRDRPPRFASCARTNALSYVVAVLNPLRTARFAEEELRCTKTDAIDALGIARFAQQKRPRAAQLPGAATEELRELERLRERLAEDFALAV
jgi:transposase